MIEENWDDPDQPPFQCTDEAKTSFGRNRNFRSGFTRSSQYNEKRNNFFQWKKQNKILENSGFSKTYMKVEDSKIGRIIGRQGSKIKELEERTGAKIKVGDYCQKNSYLRQIIITGSEESQKKCQELIEDLVSSRPLNVVYDAPNDSVPYIDWDLLNELAVKAEAEKWAKCPPIKKNFYIEDPEISKMTEEEVENFRKQKNNIVVKHVFGGSEKILNPINSFGQAFRYFPDILREIEKQGFKTPSPIQCQAWPILLSGKDLIGIAQTGTGKTLAFLFPALIHIDGQEIPRSKRGGANVLIIAPTRELALQIEKEVEKYSYKGIKSVCVYGGGNRKEQMKVITDGVEIIIATPGRLNDLVEAKVIDVSSVTYLVLDEADRMLDMGFEPQIRKILLDIRPDRQSIMTSATWPSKVQTLAQKYMCNPVQVYIGSLDLTAVHSVSQTVLVVHEDKKKDYLFDFIRNLREEDKIIVFVSKKIVADDLSCDLSLDRIPCQCIHGDREQVDREQALDDFKTGAVRILIATDVASRGLDISDITKVFNFDFPRNIEEYVHRVGRTGRAGKTGEAITLFTRADWGFASELITIMEEANQPVPQELYDMKERFLSSQQRRQEDGKHGRGGWRKKFGNDFNKNNF